MIPIVNPYLRLWTPSEIATQAWFDADDAATIIEAGGFVSQWNDKSGNARNLTQGVGANQPQTGIRQLNGKNILDFDGNDYLAKTSFPVSSFSMSMIAVAVIDAIDNASDGLVTTSAAKDFGLVANNAGQFDGSIVCVGASNPPNTPLSGGPFPGPSIYNALVTTLSGNRIQAYVDGTQRANVGYIGGISGSVTFRVFADRSATQFPDGAVGEVIVMTSATTAVRQRIEGYLAWKWGIQGNLPVSHPYKSQPPYSW